MQTTRIYSILVLGLTLVKTGFGVHDSVLNVSSFRGFQVYRTQPQTKEQADYLQGIRETSQHYDFWTEVMLGRSVDIMVPPGFQQQLETHLGLMDIKYQIMIEDVESLIELEKIPAIVREEANPRHAMTWTEYHSVEDIYSYLDYLEETYDFVSTQEIGKSYEGRSMRVVSVCVGGCGNKPAVWIDGGIHAREWISLATVTWMLRELVENSQEGANSDILNGLDWYILPSHNPDGYEFSRTNNRMWRKTRSDNGGWLHCLGVDANRNWGFHWNEGGSSNDRCQDTYHGPSAFSEIENVNVRDFVSARADNIIFYNNIHSYSQLILLPWGYSSTPPQDYDQMYILAMLGSDALTAVHGKYYETGCIPCLLYPASGGSIDWAHGEAGIGFATSMELRDTGNYGFLLPPEQIIPTAEEVWAFHHTVIRELMLQQKNKNGFAGN